MLIKLVYRACFSSRADPRIRRSVGARRLGAKAWCAAGTHLRPSASTVEAAAL